VTLDEIILLLKRQYPIPAIAEFFVSETSKPPRQFIYGGVSEPSRMLPHPFKKASMPVLGSNPIFSHNRPNQPDHSLSLGHSVRQHPISVDARQFAYATIVNGGRFTQAEQIFVFCNIKPPLESQFYQEQKFISDAECGCGI
jgi:hypothetical protein